MSKAWIVKCEKGGKHGQFLDKWFAQLQTRGTKVICQWFARLKNSNEAPIHATGRIGSFRQISIVTGTLLTSIFWLLFTVLTNFSNFHSFCEIRSSRWHPPNPIFHFFLLTWRILQFLTFLQLHSNLDISLACDTSPHGVGAVISHDIDDSE